MSEAGVRIAIHDERLRAHVVGCLEFVGERIADASSASSVVVTDDPGRHAEGDATLIVVRSRGARAPSVAGNPVVAATIESPLSQHVLMAALDAAARLVEQRAFDWPQPDRRTVRFEALVGASAPMRKLRELMGKVADRDVTVLITGEPGTGKELAARCLHGASHRAQGPFVPVNCSAIPAELIESELFGHEKGAFSGAIASKPGRLELADGGTLLLDEIGELPMSTQVKLLRVLQERCFERVGGCTTIRANVRVIAATQRDLEAMVEHGAFREELYYRLNVFPLAVPALRERREDLPALAQALALEAEQRQGGRVQFDERAMRVLARYDWPGNVRELANLVERLSIASVGGLVHAEDLPAKMQGEGDANSTAARRDGERPEAGLLDPDRPPLLPVNGIDLKDYMNRLERSLIQQALDDTHSVVARAADRLHIRRTTLVEKMRKHGLQRSDAVDL